MKRTQSCYEFIYVSPNNYGKKITSDQLNKTLVELDAFNPEVKQLTATTVEENKSIINSLWCIIEYDIS